MSEHTAHLKLLDPITSTSPPQLAEVIGSSDQRLELRSSRLLFPKALVQVRFLGRLLLGQVESCVPTEQGCVATVRVLPDFPA